MDVESGEFMREAELACAFHSRQWCYYNIIKIVPKRVLVLVMSPIPFVGLCVHVRACMCVVYCGKTGYWIWM